MLASANYYYYNFSFFLFGQRLQIQLKRNGNYQMCNFASVLGLSAKPCTDWVNRDMQT